MSSKAAKIIHIIIIFCAVICTVIGFFYVYTAVLAKLIHDALTDDNDDDFSGFDDEEKDVVPVIVEAADDDDDTDECTGI